MAIAIGIMQTVVGAGDGGYAGDGGPATQALIGEAYGCAFCRLLDKPWGTWDNACNLKQTFGILPWDTSERANS